MLREPNPETLRLQTLRNCPRNSRDFLKQTVLNLEVMDVIKLFCRIFERIFIVLEQGSIAVIRL